MTYNMFGGTLNLAPSIYLSPVDSAVTFRWLHHSLWTACGQVDVSLN